MKKLVQIFSIPDLRRKILLSILLLVIARILAHIPLPGVDLNLLQQFFRQNEAFGLLNLFSGGAMENFSIIFMGVGPYITASIIFQLLQWVIPRLEEISKEGEWGRQKINQYTRYATVPLAFIQAFAMLNLLKSQGILPEITGMNLLVTLFSVTAGTVLIMWLGELITENGIGNGISLIIALGILSEYPNQIRNTGALLDTGILLNILGFAALAVFSIALIIYITEGVRQIPITYARRMRATRSTGSIDSYLPLRVNSAGVIPIIFALSILVVPTVVAKFFTQARSEWLANIAQKIVDVLQTGSLYYGLLYFGLVVAFTYFYTFVVFKPDQIAENLQKQGGFIPGIRPGNETSKFLFRVINRITLAGAVFLGVIAVLPFLAQYLTKVNTIVLGGTGLLIIVSVILETSRQINAQLVMRTYDKY